MSTFKETAIALENLYRNATVSNLYSLTEIDRNILFLAVEVIRHKVPTSIRNYNYALGLVEDIRKIDADYHKAFIDWMENDIKSFYQPAQAHIDFIDACNNEQ